MRGTPLSHCRRPARHQPSSTTATHPDDPGHPEVAAAIRRVEQAALAAGVPLNGFAPDAEAATALKERGYRSRSLGFDWLIYQRAVTEALAPPSAARGRPGPGGAPT